MISKIFSLRNYVMKQIMKPNKDGIMQIPDPGKVDFGEMLIKEELFKKGIDPKLITSSKQLDNILNTPTVTPHSTPKKSGEVIEVDFDKGRWKDIDPEKKAGGGVAGLLGENHRVPYIEGGMTLKEVAEDTKIDNFIEYLDLIELMRNMKGTKFHDAVYKPRELEAAGGGIAGMLGEPTYADGGRTGFKKGTKFDPKRRTVLKGIAALATVPIIGKYFKWAKPLAKSSKVLTQVPIKQTADMPAWFKPLVNKVIKEGDDVTKKFATKEREIVHTKKLGDPKDKFADEITVTQDLETGNVRVEYDAAHNMGEAPIQLDYKAGEVIEQGSKKGTKTKPEFSAVESEPRVTNWDGDIEWDGENIVSKVDDLLTDTTKLETYATGKKPNIKKLLKSEQKQKQVKKLNKDQMGQVEYIEQKYGPGQDPDPTDFASGGRVPRSAGGVAGMLGE